MGLLRWLFAVGEPAASSPTPLIDYQTTMPVTQRNDGRGQGCKYCGGGGSKWDGTGFVRCNH